MTTRTFQRWRTAWKSRLLLFLLAVSLGTVTGRGAPSRPVALVGDSYGRSEKISLIRNIMSVSPEAQVRFEDLGTFIDVARLSEFSLVILANKLQRPLTDDESRAFADYVSSGGHVLLIGTIFASMSEEWEALAWTGIRQTNWQRQGTPSTAQQAQHPWLKGVLSDNSSPLWLKARFLATPLEDGMVPVIGTEAGASLVGIHRLGQGWVAFLGDELFRMRDRDPEKHADSQFWIRMIANIVEDAGVLLEQTYHQSLFDAAGRDDAVWLWAREWQSGETYGPRFDPPVPAPEERIESLAIDMAIDEYELIQVNLTPLKDLGLVQAEFGSESFPVKQARIFVQDRPDPIPWEKDPALAQEAPYWLMPPEAVAPRGDSQFMAPPCETRILWLKFDSFDLSPGHYDLSLSLDFEKYQRITLPVTVRVHAVRLPRNRHITLMPSGTVYGSVVNAAPARRFMENLESHGYGWSSFNVVRPTDARIRGETEPINAVTLRRCADLLTDGHSPVLDFFAYDDWIENSIEHYQTRVRTGDPTHYLRGLIHRAGIKDADAITRLEAWFCSEFSRYLREKGVRVMVCSLGDELSRKALIDRYIPWAQRMNAYGLGCSSSFTGIQHIDPDLNKQIFPYVKLWTLNRGLTLPFTDALREGTVQVRPDAIIGTYGAGEGRGTEIRKIPSQSRFLGWESWKLGVRNCAPNPYFKGWLYYLDYRRDRGIAGERLVAYLDFEDQSVPLLNSPFLEGIREGMEDGNLCAILSWYLEHLPASPLTASVRKRVERVMGPDADALLPTRVVKGSNKLSVLAIQADSAAYRTAKHEVLACLEALRTEAVRHVQPSLYWNEIPLMTDGQPRAALYTGDTPLPADLKTAIFKACGRNLPVIRNATTLDPRYPVAIVLGNTTQNPLVQSLLAAFDAEAMSATYPGAGRYSIREWPRAEVPGGIVLQVAGPDDAGSAKGARHFGRFLWGEGAWLLPDK